MTGCATLCMRRKKREKKYAQERGFLDQGEVVVWRDFRPPHVSEAILKLYIQYMMSEHFVQWSRSDAENQNKRTHGSFTMYISGIILFVSHAKQMATIFKRKPRLRDLFVETHMRNDDC
uniref:Uncharacterized protein n=1 Tax=Populus davidiana TaxID=266767 RepID=A0A6M2EY33_9ROSI